MNTYFQKWEEHRVTYKSGVTGTGGLYLLVTVRYGRDWRLQGVDRRECGWQMFVCRMTLVVRKRKRAEAE